MDQRGIVLRGTRYPWVPEWVVIPSGPELRVHPDVRRDYDSTWQRRNTRLSQNGRIKRPLLLEGLRLPLRLEPGVHPIGPQPGAFPLPSLFGKSNSWNVEVEYDALWRFRGRGWVIQDRRSVLRRGPPGSSIAVINYIQFRVHPIFMWSVMRTVTQLIQPFTGLIIENPFGGQPATQATCGSTAGIRGAGQEIEFRHFRPRGVPWGLCSS